MDKPEFKNNDSVIVKFPFALIHGYIVGIATRHIVDTWIVRADKADLEVLKQQGYDFSCFVAPGSLISLVE